MCTKQLFSQYKWEYESINCFQTSVNKCLFLIKGFDPNPTLARLLIILGKGEMDSNCVGKIKALTHG